MSLFDNPSIFSLKSSEPVYTKLRFPIQSGETLLKKEFCQSLLNTLQVILPQSSYQQYYYPAIEQFAHYVQVLPFKKQGLFSEIEGLLEYSLSCATYTLIASLNYLYPNRNNLHQIIHTPKRSVELYATFTSALFKDIDLLTHYYEVNLYDQKEKFVAIWNPFEGTMLEYSNACFLRFKYLIKSNTLKLLPSCLATNILSNHSRTREGFLSMTRYPDILEYWLASLVGETQRVPLDSVMSLIPFGTREAIDRRLEERQLRKRFMQYKHPDNFYSTQYPLGERFLHWLREQEKSKRLMINHSEEIGVRRLSSGVLVPKATLLTFSKLYGVNPEAVAEQFQSLMELYTHPLKQPKYDIGQSAAGQWLLISNPSLLFSAGRLPPLFSGHHLMQPTRAPSINSNKTL